MGMLIVSPCTTGIGNYIDSHNIMLLLIHYLHKYKGYTGKVVIGFSSTLQN
jgi:hypothetical protein